MNKIEYVIYINNENEASKNAISIFQQQIFNKNFVTYWDIINHDYVLSKDGLKWIEFNKLISVLRGKYSNILDDFKSFDGFAFPSSDYVTQFENLKKKVKLLQISNVNQTEWIINDTQKFEYVPDKYLKNKKKYLLNSKCILISLTGGTDTDNDITSYFDNSFKAFLNQRVAAFSMKEYNKDYFFYFYAMTKTKFFKEQWLGKGGIQKNTVASDRAKTYLPKIDNLEIVNFVSILTQAIINKEKLIRERYEAILKAIETELLENQQPDKFSFELPRINELEEVGRLDTGLYSETFKKNRFLVNNYKNGFSNIYELGFTMSRGQNLQESNIGQSVYLKKHYKSFYSLALPTNISDYGTVQKIIYLGNSNQLKTLSKGEIIFGAEGTFRSFVVCDETEKYITNIHGITLFNSDFNLSVFVKCYMDYIVKKGLIDCVKVGGNGGSFAQKYWEVIPFPKFDKTKQDEIAKLYHNANIEYKTDTFTLANFLDKDNEYNQEAGIYELDKTAKQLKEILNQTIDDIVNDKEIVIKFNI